MKSTELKVHNLPYDRKIDETIDAKPYFLFIILAIFGAIITFVQGGTLIGITLVVLSAISLMFLPSRVLVEFSNEYLVIYNRASHNECLMIYYDDILSWNYIRGVAYDELEINLKDGTKETIEAFSRLKFENAMNNYVKDKKIKKKKK